MSGYVYVASPYTDESPLIKSQRYWRACNFCAQLLGQHIIPYSPIVHWHHIAIRHGMESDSEYWIEANTIMLSAAESLYVLRLDGWSVSKGVTGEITAAEIIGKPIQSWAEVAGRTPQFERVA